MAALVILVIIIAIIVRLYEKNTNATCNTKKKLNGKTVLVTGGTAGMGLEIAKEFARRDARVIIACPFEDEGINAGKHIKETTGNRNVVFKFLDLASLESVRAFAKDILETEDRLDILINNAGVGVPTDYVTKDGMSFIMQVNYFGHFLLTLLLLPVLRKSGSSLEPSRIVNTSSIMHQLGILDIRNLNRTDHLFMVQIYGKSKLCLVLFARELAKRLKGKSVVINSVDPGAVGTRIFDSAGKLFGGIITVLTNLFYKTPWEGAQTALHVALDTRAGSVSGEFFKNCLQTRAARWAYNDELASMVWEKSLLNVQLDSAELKMCLKSTRT